MKKYILFLGLTVLPLSAEPTIKPKEVAPPVADKAPRPADAEIVKDKVAATISNLRDMGLALLEFENDYGSYPSKESAKVVREVTESKLALNFATSNDYFRQLLVSGLSGTEKFFQIGMPEKVADNIFNSDETALAKDECSFAYAPGGSSSVDASRPLVLVPLVAGQLKFDPLPLGGKAAILMADNSVKVFPISATGDVLINGKSVFDPTQPFWNGKKPEVVWPK